MDELISEQNGFLNWGTKLDAQKEIPIQYIGKSFYQIDIDDLKEFFEMNNLEKFKMAYWIERHSSRRFSRMGFIIGIFVGVFVGLLLYKLIS